MKFSTKAEYGLKAMVNLAQSFPRQKNLKLISRQEKISAKYLEQMIGKLKRNNLVTSTKGKDGGYTLAREPKKITVGEIIEILEGPIAPMRCAGEVCSQEQTCASSFVWMKLGQQIKKTLNSIRLSDLIKKHEQ